MGQALSSAHIPAIAQIENELKTKHPEMSQEEIRRQTTQRLQSQRAQVTQATVGHSSAVQQAHKAAMHQAALNAAAGGMIRNGNFAGQPGIMTNEQVQAFHHARQAQAIQRASGVQGPIGMPGLQAGAGMGMMGGMTGSPVLNMARPVSQHASQGPHSRSATPREQRSASNSINGQQGSPRLAQQGMQI